MTVQFKVAKRVVQMVFERIDTVEDAVVKGLFPQIVPEMFNWIGLRRVRREREQAQIVGQPERSTLMPPGAIEDHQDPVDGMTRADLIEKRLHAGAIDVRQDQQVERAISHGDGCISVRVLLRYHRLTQWANGFGALATPRVGDATEARFVLKHQADRPVVRPRAVDFEEDVGEFFSGVLGGHIGLGVSLVGGQLAPAVTV